MKLKLSQIMKRVYRQSIWKLSKTNNKRVVFSSFSGNSYSDNPKAISERLHDISPELEIIWVNNGTPLRGAPAYIKQVNKLERNNYYKVLASAKVIVTNFGYNDIPKKANQRYIQTWHGDRAFKKILYDSPFAKNPFYPESKSGFCDLAIAGSDYGENQYRSAFKYKGEILKVGTPRDDILLHVTNELVKEKKKIIGVPDNNKYLLYAPTLRRANQHTSTKQNIQGINISETIHMLEKKYGGSWKCLLRAHPGVSGLTGKGIKDSSVIDVSGYPDMTDLMIISDILITDYSSCAGDYALLKRPVFLFQDDIDEYLKKDRTFYFEISDSPYFVAHSQDELNKKILSTSLEVAAENCEDILRFYGTHETGDSATAVANRIIEYTNA